MMKRHFSYLIISLFLLAFSCKSRPDDKNTFIPVFSTYKADSTETRKRDEKNEIFYGILTPVEVCAIFNRLNVPYNNATLNPVSNKDKYLSSSKAAINTGIYGVDFGYLKMFGIGKEMIKSIHSDISEPDTIVALMQKAFTKMENHLRADGRESTAGLMVLGGWVEAMYFATQLVYDPLKPDPEVVQKIAEQKYTLTSLLSFLKNYYDDPVVVYYTKKLKFLKKYFDTFDIYFKKGDLEIDTSKQVFRSSGTEMTVTVETLNNIRNYISKLRTEMVTP
jgi:hypothetical protein